MDLKGLIRQGLSLFSFDSSAVQVETYEAYLLCLSRWNRTFNLTAIHDLEKMVSHHLMDSLSIAPMIDGDAVIDVASGAGLPGIPLAVHFPEKRFTLLDSNGKKTRFMTQACIELALENVTVVQSRVEDYKDCQFEQAVCRAFAPLKDIADSCAHIIQQDGNILAMKGRDERLPPSSPLCVKNRVKLDVPLLSAQRWVIRLIRQQDREP